MTTKPSIADVHSFLQRNDGLIVHFSGSPPGISFGTNPGYPRDLCDVVAGKAHTGLSCSIVTPKDNFHSPKPRNAFGSIGVILDLTTLDSLMSVSPNDAGSYNRNGIRHFPNRDITVTDLEDSLRLRTEHNEWGLQHYRVCGILAVEPFDYWDHTTPPSTAYTNIVDIQATFSPLTVYSFWQGRIVMPSAQITASVIYLKCVA